MPRWTRRRKMKGDQKPDWLGNYTLVGVDYSNPSMDDVPDNKQCGCFAAVSNDYEGEFRDDLSDNAQSNKPLLRMPCEDDDMAAFLDADFDAGRLDMLEYNGEVVGVIYRDNGDAVWAMNELKALV